MQRGRSRKLSEAFWLVICVFLFYHHPICVVSAVRTFGKVSTNSEGRNNEEDSPFTSDNGVKKCKENWQRYDGTECVCATNDTSRCTNTGAFVCDNMGDKYPSVCHFLLAMCQETIPSERTLQTCGACKILRLSGDKLLGNKDVYFVREGADKGYDTVYKSNDDQRLQIFFEESQNAWIIGQRKVDGPYAAIIQHTKVPYPQDSRGGMLIAVRKGKLEKFKLDMSLRLECINDNLNKGHRMKRFGFLATLLVVSLFAAGTSTTLKVIQSKKGCLYYPSVCRLRNEINNDLKPKVVQMKNDFLSRYPNATGMPQQVKDIQSQIRSSQNSFSTVKKLYFNINTTLSNLTFNYGDLETESPKFGNALHKYKDWLKNVHSEAIGGIIDINLDILTTVTTSVISSKLALGGTFLGVALAGVGAALNVFAIGFAAVDIVSSIRQERKAYDDLKDAKDKFMEAKNNLRAASRNMKDFQKKFCQTVVHYLRVMSEKGKQYHSSFAKLNTFINSMYGGSKSMCSFSQFYSKITYNSLSRLKYLLDNLLRYLSKNILELEQKLLELEAVQEFIDKINTKIRLEKESPKELFSFAKKNKPDLAKSLFQSLFDLLQYISNVSDHACYWGHNLENIRKGVTTERNYLTSTMCPSPTISDQIGQAVNQSSSFK